LGQAQQYGGVQPVAIYLCSTKEALDIEIGPGFYSVGYNPFEMGIR